MGKFDAAMDLFFAVAGIAQFVLMICAAVYMFSGRKFTLLTPDPPDEIRGSRAGPGRRFWLSYAIALICALGVFAIWFRC